MWSERGCVEQGEISRSDGTKKAKGMYEFVEMGLPALRHPGLKPQAVSLRAFSTPVVLQGLALGCPFGAQLSPPRRGLVSTIHTTCE